jgi:hypothetical protein
MRPSRPFPSFRLLLPGYFERKLARQLQVDGVFMRASVRKPLVAEQNDTRR